MLTDRQAIILKAIIQGYTTSGQPVGSKVLTSQLPIHVSSATIRNEMAYLEKQGLITKTHLSSGRVPSIKGYRYYVDHLKHDLTVTPQDLSLIHKSFDVHFDHIDEIVKESANILSQLTDYTTITFKPEQIGERKLSGFRLVPLGNHRVIAIIITDDGDVENQTFQVDKTVTGEQLEAVTKLINDKLVGKSISDVMKILKSEITSEIQKYLHTPAGFIKTFDEVLAQSFNDNLYVSGEYNLLDFVKHDDVSYLKPLYSFLKDSNDVRDFIGNSDQPISVKIGSESNNKLLKNYSLITGSYDVGAHGRGVIAVLGPTRMPYSRIIGLVGAFRKELADKLLGYYDENK